MYYFKAPSGAGKQNRFSNKNKRITTKIDSLKIPIAVNLTLILLRCIQQPCGYNYNVTGQLQEPKDLTRPATVKVVYTILYSSEASLLQA